jgi:hypothetical protein
MIIIFEDKRYTRNDAPGTISEAEKKKNRNKCEKEKFFLLNSLQDQESEKDKL